MATNTRGTRNRSRPTRRSDIDVVAPSNAVANDTDRPFDDDVPCAPQAGDRQRHTEHVDAAPLTDERQEERERDERQFEAQPRRQRSQRHLAGARDTGEEHRVRGEGPERFARRDDDRQDEQHRRRELALRSQLVHTRLAVHEQHMAVTTVRAAHVTPCPTTSCPDCSSSSRRDWRTRKKRPPVIAKVTETPMSPARPVARRSLSTPFTA